MTIGTYRFDLGQQGWLVSLNDLPESYDVTISCPPSGA